MDTVKAVLTMLFQLSIWLASVNFVYTSHVDLTSMPGHLKPFGTGLTHEIESVQGFPQVKQFFRNNVFRAVPLKMVGAAQESQAFRLWDDEYFLSLPISFI